MDIRPARMNDAGQIQALIFAAADPEHNEDLDAQGRERFIASNSLDAVSERISRPDFLMLCCHADASIVGLIRIKRPDAIDQLFVSAAYRRRGIARCLWLEAKARCEREHGQKSFRVRSSTMAVPLYESFGFRLAGAKCRDRGVAYYPMVFSPEASL
jgi:GNAT superfamily N-acetyltransferase